MSTGARSLVVHAGFRPLTVARKPLTWLQPIRAFTQLPYKPLGPVTDIFKGASNMRQQSKAPLVWVDCEVSSHFRLLPT